MTNNNNNSLQSFPFTSNDPPAYRCRCGVLLRKSYLMNKKYEVSEYDDYEILKQTHVCFKNKNKTKLQRMISK